MERKGALKKSTEVSNAKKRKAPVEDEPRPKGINKSNTATSSKEKLTSKNVAPLKKSKDAAVKSVHTSTKPAKGETEAKKESARSSIDDLFSGVSAAKKANQVAKIKKEKAEEKQKKKEEATVAGMFVQP